MFVYGIVYVCERTEWGGGEEEDAEEVVVAVVWSSSVSEGGSWADRNEWGAVEDGSVESCVADGWFVVMMLIDKVEGSW